MNLPEILTELGIDYKEHGQHQHATKGRLQVDCPWCSKDSGHYRLGLSNWGGAACWSCGPVHFSDSLAEISNQPWQRIKELLGLWDKGRLKERETKGKLVLPVGLGPLLPIHRKYLKGRGFDPDELVRLWGLQGIGLSARFPWRIFIPAIHHGKTVSWTTRSVLDTGTRYVNAGVEEEAIPLKKLLFGEDFIRHATIVTEGPFDCMRIGPGCVATCGIGFSRTQVLRTSKYPVRVIVFDSEPKAQDRARELCEALAPFPGKTIRVELDAADPGSASKNEVRRLRKEYLE